MSVTDVQIINLGSGKVGASRVNRIDPPQTPFEGFMATGYEHWKNSELTKRRWVFATEYNYPLTLDTELTDQPDGKNYKFLLPNDCLRPIRTKTSEWVQRGRYLFTGYKTLSLDYVRQAKEAEFDPLFVDVLAARIAVEAVEYKTQSNSKKQSAINDHYKPAVKDAAQANAFVIGPEDIQEDDADFSWVSARYG